MVGAFFKPLALTMAVTLAVSFCIVLQEARRELLEGTEVQRAWELAAQRRLRPVAMTVLATSLALSPLAFALGAGAQLMQPLAIAVIGGFVLSGPAVLLLLPGLYCLLDPHGRLAGKGPREVAPG